MKDNAKGWALLRSAVCKVPVAWAEISDLLLSCDASTQRAYLDYLVHHLPEYRGGWFAGQPRTFRVGPLSLKMRWIPPGSFSMGALEGEKGAAAYEKPRRTVHISRGFWIMETPVTQTQWTSLMEETPSLFYVSGDDAPVENISWYDAAAFANQLSSLDGSSPCFELCHDVEETPWSRVSDYLSCDGWRLPTEAEWEFAARAGETGTLYGPLDQIAWFYANSGSRTQPVAQKEPNAWGLYDVLGNVWEWCYDAYDGQAYKTLPPVDPLCEGTGYRVKRGSAWLNVAWGVRLAERNKSLPDEQNYALGVRLVRGYPSPPQ
ncbi:MAG: formylglycine-generating enzyme family protein [Myxococcales bacterium]|nr:formylglycine-generating enzyme family protein [Myxococcales bacterium]